MHKFLKDRKAKEFYIVCRIDDYHNNPNERGGFSPRVDYGNKGGYLWPTAKLAKDAAVYMIQKFPTQTYGVMKLVFIAETTHAPVHCVKVGRGS